ncbi:MAG: Maf family protein [Candidatus Pacearchaeota archaeon]|nr:Maf family protein [Candidatus Pacearchaeota archaeon]
MKEKKIILASVSPRRKGLLQQIGINFEVIPSNFKEDMTLKMPPHKLVVHLALGKAKDVANRIKEGIVIGADTFFVLNKEFIGKPKNEKDAIKTLKKISGKTLKVYSGIAIIDSKTGKTITDYEVTDIKIRKMSDHEIKSYVKTKEPLDKAASIAIQGLGAIFIEKLNGCYTNVIGLPLHCLANNLKKFGVNIFKYERWKNYVE